LKPGKRKAVVVYLISLVLLGLMTTESIEIELNNVFSLSLFSASLYCTYSIRH